jgi:SOS-response transcriptional repressor LexA
MEKIQIEGIDFIVIEREDGSKQTIELNPANPEYAKMMAEPGEHD